MSAPEASAIASFDGGLATVVVTGEIDYDTMPRLREVLGACFTGEPSRIGVDLSGVTFCDCAGLNVLLWARQQAHHAGIGFQVDGIRAPIVNRLFDIVGVSDLFRARSATGWRRSPDRRAGASE
ncbi:STAS domain-containing protein [Kitasatospora purpeofusca]|uniref:STAS domain-containing protein n=1 Tax=Kitasatospora purpeofusca TaxID=67352 RepID=UPI0036CAA47B